MGIKLENQVCNIPDAILALLQKDVAEIKVALLGNEYNPAGGLLYRTTDLEKEIENLQCELDRMQRRYEKIIWTVGGGASMIAVIASFLMKLWMP